MDSFHPTLLTFAPPRTRSAGVLTWEQCLQNKGAWDTLMWFAILTGMAGQLNALGVIAHFSSAVGNALAALSLGWPVVWAVLCVTYFLMHYVFASQTGHVAALYRCRRWLPCRCHSPVCCCGGHLVRLFLGRVSRAKADKETQPASYGPPAIKDPPPLGWAGLGWAGLGWAARGSRGRTARDTGDLRAEAGIPDRRGWRRKERFLGKTDRLREGRS